MADDSSKYYADVGGGYTIVDEADLSDSTLHVVSGMLSANGGYEFVAALGRKFGLGMRVELEVSYRQNDLDQISVGFFGVTVGIAINGEVTTLAGMVNLYYDFEMDGKLTPYIGGGLGLASIKIDSTDVATDDSDMVVAYQGMVGLRYPLGDRVSALRRLSAACHGRSKIWNHRGRISEPQYRGRPQL